MSRLVSRLGKYQVLNANETCVFLEVHASHEVLQFLVWFCFSRVALFMHQLELAVRFPQTKGVL